MYVDTTVDFVRAETHPRPQRAAPLSPSGSCKYPRTGARRCLRNGTYSGGIQATRRSPACEVRSGERGHDGDGGLQQWQVWVKTDEHERGYCESRHVREEKTIANTSFLHCYSQNNDGGQLDLATVAPQIIVHTCQMAHPEMRHVHIYFTAPPTPPPLLTLLAICIYRGRCQPNRETIAW